MSLFTGLLGTIFDQQHRRAFSLRSSNRPVEELVQALLGSEGETTGLALATDILNSYEAMDEPAKQDFFNHLASAMKIDTTEVRNALDSYEKSPSKSSYQAFKTAVEPKHQALFRRLNQVPGATAALVRMRADLIKLSKNLPERTLQLETLNLDLCQLLKAWFNRGFLVMRPISWESPAHILEKIIAYEAVHAIDSWEDLRRRLEPQDRRCFAFFHPAMPDEPLIFVEVALTDGIPDSVQKLLAEDRLELPAEVINTAVFYSISNCQAGLSGISFGSSLIKQVAADLAIALPKLKNFITLSPIPGLTRWLQQNNLPWDTQNPTQMKEIAAAYLLHAKADNALPVDPVARFHLGNGALIHAVHANADLSEKGIKQSAGTMVNYRYDLDQMPQNHEKFTTNKQIIAAAEVKNAAKIAIKRFERPLQQSTPAEQ